MLKLQQGQVWLQGETYLRITQLERLSVEYKAMTSLTSGSGKTLTATKKEFCRLIKGATLRPES
jgi:hypothetical protein